jgi:hypothetical protein
MSMTVKEYYNEFARGIEINGAWYAPRTGVNYVEIGYVIDDDTATRDAIVAHLESHGLKVTREAVRNGKRAIAAS